jgi:dTDP-glucose 4,6-dehydratase
MKILVTGGAGFIGSNFISYILNNHNSDKVICVDSLTYASNINNLKDHFSHDNFSFYQIDISNKQELEDIFRSHDIDIIINFAAESHVDNSIKDPSVFIKSNVFGTFVLLELARKYRIKRFHQVSTDEVYGYLEIEDTSSFTEESNLNPSSPYSASKAASDLLCISYHKTYKMNITISRSTNNFGRYQHHEKLIPKIILNALNDIKIPIYGNGENLREWISVDDHCRGILSIIQFGQIGHIYNIGSGKVLSNNTLVRIILDLMNKPYELIDYVEDRPGHDLKYAVDYSKLHIHTKWKPIDVFEEYLKQTIDHYKLYNKLNSFNKEGL